MFTYIIVRIQKLTPFVISTGWNSKANFTKEAESSSAHSISVELWPIQAMIKRTTAVCKIYARIRQFCRIKCSIIIGIEVIAFHNEMKYSYGNKELPGFVLSQPALSTTVAYMSYT